MRLDRALVCDLRTALGSWPLRLYLLLQPLAAIVFVARRGDELASSIPLIWAGLSALAFTAWWAGRHQLACPEADPVPAARARASFVLAGVVGMTLVGSGVFAPAGLVLLALGFGGWLWSALRWGGFGGLGGLHERLPLNLEANASDLVAASANALLLQANVGLVAVLAYRRHRAVVPIGVAHALAIG